MISIRKASSRFIWKTSALVGAVLMLAGCGSFPLSGGAYPPPGKTSQEVQLDVLTCQDKAKVEANTAARQAGAFALGLTIVGAPIAFELEKKKQREVYTECMTARGYKVLPVNDGPSSAGATPGTPGTPPLAALPPTPQLAPPVQPAAAQSMPETSTPAAPAAATTDTAAQLEKLNDLKRRGLITEEEFQRKRKEILDRI